MPRILTAGACAALLAGRAAALEPTLVLYPVLELPVDAGDLADPIRLPVSSVARVVATEDQRAAVLGSRVPLDSLKGRARVDRDSLAVLLHAVPGLDGFTVTGPASVRIREPHSPQRAARMLADARLFLERHVAATWPGEYRNLSVRFVGRVDALPVGLHTDWRFDAGDLALLRRRSAIWLLTGDSGQRVPLWFGVEGEVRTWNAVEDLPARTRAGEPLFVRGWTDIARVDPASRAAPSAGQQLTVALAAGQALLERHLEPAPAIEFGADALVVSRAGLIEVTSIATALGRGFVGDTIALRSPGSGEEFDAVVTGPNRVEVSSRGKH